MQVEELVELLEVLNLSKSGKSEEHPYKLGESYFIRTVTHYYTGKLTAVYEQELVLSDVAWIADTGRFNEALVKGNLSEVEPMPGNVIVGRGAVVDATIWNHALPRDAK